MRKQYLALLVGILANAGPVSGQSGLLIGVRTDSTRYETIWLVPTVDKAGPLVRLRGLIVPRTDGFWRFGVDVECSIQKGKTDWDGDTTEVFTNRVHLLVREKIGDAQSFAAWEHSTWEPSDPAALADNCEKAADAAQTPGDGRISFTRNSIRLKLNDSRAK